MPAQYVAARFTSSEMTVGVGFGSGVVAAPASGEAPSGAADVTGAAASGGDLTGPDFAAPVVSDGGLCPALLPDFGAAIFECPPSERRRD